MKSNWLKENKTNLIVSVYVLPRSSRTEVVGIYEDTLKIKLKSPPVDNEANKELVRFLAQKLKISKSNINITSGQLSKRKILTILGCTSEYVRGIFSI